jgi:hypothetical protein
MGGYRKGYMLPIVNGKLSALSGWFLIQKLAHMADIVVKGVPISADVQGILADCPVKVNRTQTGRQARLTYAT